MKSGDKIEQRWKAGAVLDDIRYPYVIVDDWYTEEEEKAVWKELDFYNTMDQKARAENTIVAKKNGVPLANSYRFNYKITGFFVKSLICNFMLISFY